MNQDEHQRERMRAWVAAFTATIPTDCGAHVTADGMLASFDKRFPAPAAVDTDRERRENLHCVISDLTDQCREANAELASLRQKARYWDAVASGKVRLYIADDSNFYVAFDTADDAIGGHQFPTAAEAVEAAIAAGALK